MVRPARAQLADDPEQPSRLLGRQHRGRLVEDEDAGAAIEGAQDLDPLEVAHGQVADPCARVDPQVVGVAQAPDGRLGGRPVEQAPRSGSRPMVRFSATLSDGKSMKCWWTIAMPSR